MKIKNALLTLAVGALAMGCNSGTVNQTSAPLKTAADTASFYLGYMYGSGIQRTGLEEPNSRKKKLRLRPRLWKCT